MERNELAAARRAALSAEKELITAQRELELAAAEFQRDLSSLLSLQIVQDEVSRVLQAPRANRATRRREQALARANRRTRRH